MKTNFIFSMLLIPLFYLIRLISFIKLLRCRIYISIISSLNDKNYIKIQKKKSIFNLKISKNQRIQSYT